MLPVSWCDVVVMSNHPYRIFFSMQVFSLALPENLVLRLFCPQVSEVKSIVSCKKPAADFQVMQRRPLIIGKR